MPFLNGAFQVSIRAPRGPQLPPRGRPGWGWWPAHAGARVAGGGRVGARDGTRMAMDNAGQVRVAQHSNPQVVLYDAPGKALRSWAYTQASGGS
jgi:hypothetical protein